MNPIEEYFAAHKTQLWLFKHAVVWGTPTVSALAIEYLQNSDLTVKVTLIAVLTALNVMVSKLNPEQVWGGIGARKRKR
jgi:hypothetical protein